MVRLIVGPDTTPAGRLAGAFGVFTKRGTRPPRWNEGEDEGHLAHDRTKAASRALLTLFVISVVIFGATELLPGDLARELLGQSATEETLAALREQLGLNDPAPLRYWNWLTAALQGDFGVSMATQQPIADLVGARLGNTLFLALYAAALAVPLSLALGVLAALWRNSMFDRASNAAGAHLDLLSGVLRGLHPAPVARADRPLPVDGADHRPTTTLGDRLYMAFLPALTLTLVVTAHMMRMTRAAIINLLASPYIEMARLKGMSPLARRAASCATECAGADHQRGRAEPRLPRDRRRRGRGGVRLSGPRTADGRRGVEPRHRRGAGRRADLRRRLRAAQPDRRCAIDRHQPSPDAPAVGDDALRILPVLATDLRVGHRAGCSGPSATRRITGARPVARRRP